MGWIFQIGLTIGAFFRGWRWYALIPLGSVVAIGFLVGMATAAAGVGLVGWPTGLLVALDVLSMVILITMCFWVHPAIKAKNEDTEKKAAENPWKFKDG